MVVGIIALITTASVISCVIVAGKSDDIIDKK